NLSYVTVQAGSTFAGSGTLELPGSGPTTVAADLTVTLPVHLFANAATLDGPGRLTLAAPMTWQAGTITLGGGLEVSPGATLTLDERSGVGNVRSTALRNHGTVSQTWHGLALDSAGAVNNH